VTEVLSAPLRRLSTLGAQPIWLAEVGSAEQGGDKANWLRTLLSARDRSRISAVIWFHTDKERDWRITSSPQAAAAVTAALAGTRPAPEAEIAPARPEGVRAASLPRGACVEWSSTAPTVEITTYAGGVPVRTEIVAGPGPHAVTGLRPHVAYVFTVRALSRFGASARSAPIAPVVPSG
jgi:hypothetical protein